MGTKIPFTNKLFFLIKTDIEVYHYLCDIFLKQSRVDNKVQQSEHALSFEEED